MPPSPWWNPRRISKLPKRALSAAMRMSQASASSKPPASAQPLIAPMMGLLRRCWPRVMPPRPASALRRTVQASRSSHCGMYSPRSAPAQKASPSPVRIATSASGSDSKLRQTSHSCLFSSGLIAFFEPGRRSVMRAMRSPVW
jgi:hypothetical protein